jgi:hypothetical protein
MPETREQMVTDILASRQGKPAVKHRSASGLRPDGLPVGRPFVRGVSGNPNGRPRRGACVTEAARDKLLEVAPDGRTNLERVVTAWVELAATGDATARGQLLDRLEGRVGFLDDDESGTEALNRLADVIAASGPPAPDEE